MFTGIVTEVGTIANVTDTDGGRTLTIVAPATSSGLAIGDSVSVSGVCLTVVTTSELSFAVDVVPESLNRTTLGTLVSNAGVNLERPMAASGRFDGHIVQGHVDGVGTLASRIADGNASRIRVGIPSELERYIVEKGSITIDGMSLTVTALNADPAESGWFEVVLIPHTLGETVAGSWKVGSKVNLEVDVIAKYVERLIGAKE